MVMEAIDLIVQQLGTTALVVDTEKTKAGRCRGARCVSRSAHTHTHTHTHTHARVNTGTSLEETLIDGILYAFQEQVGVARRAAPRVG